MKKHLNLLLGGLVMLNSMGGGALSQPQQPVAPARSSDDEKVVAQSSFLSYKTVRDNFGKKFAESYFVVQVDVRNEYESKQFIVQKIDALIDPNQCLNGTELYSGFDTTKCLNIFNKYFIFPNAQHSVRKDEVIGVGKADLARGRMNIAFRILAFSASMGSILTGFKGVLGTDGVKGVNVLGTTFTDAAKLLIPDTSAEKLENLKNAVSGEDVIIKSKESKTFNIFIPTERVFYKESWLKYKQYANEQDKSTYSLKVVLDLLLLSAATGVLVDNNAPTVTAKSDDNIRRQKEKFVTFDAFTPEVTERTKLAFEVFKRLDTDLKSADKATAKKATDTLNAIVIKLKATKRFDDFIAGAGYTSASTGVETLGILTRLSRDLTLREPDEVLDAIFQNTIIKLGK